MKRAIGLAAIVSMSVASAFGFSIKPGAQVVRVEAGKIMKVSFEIENDQKDDLRITPRVRDSFVLTENKNFPAGSWLKPLFKDATVPAHGSKTVQFEVMTPAKATGELAALVSFVPDVKDTEKPVDVKGAIQTRIVTLITVSLYVRVKGTEKGEADLGDLHVINKPAQGAHAAQIQASISVKNTGNVHQRPSGQFTIYKKGDSKPAYTLDFKSGWPVMPRSDYDYMAYTDGALAPGDYEAHTTVSFSPQVTMDKKSAFTILLSGETTNYAEIK